MFLDLRYARVAVDGLDEMAGFASDFFGLQVAEQDDGTVWLRSDARNYALCLTSEIQGSAIAFSVAKLDDLDRVEQRLQAAGYSASRLSDEEATYRQCKAVLQVAAPNGVRVEIVWRPLTSGWRYHGPRDAGITGLAAVQLGSVDVASDEAFWTTGLGLHVTDWVGDAVMLSLDDSHHQVALYPSRQNCLLGVAWHVESKDNIMQNWYAAQAAQVPVVAGPDRQAASGAMYVALRSPEGLLMSYLTDMDAGVHIRDRGPRQFADSKQSHGIWGSDPLIPEFKGRDDD